MKTTQVALLLFAVLFFAACDSAEPDDPGAGEEELITRVTLNLTGGGTTVTASANDPDGDGTGFQIDDLVLTAGTSYTGTIEVADDVNNEDITAEIRAEADEHQFFFTVGGGAAGRLTVTASDTDSNNLPVGLSFNAVVSAGGGTTGTLRVVLSHFDAEPKNGVDRSDETDIDVTFPVTIQ